MLAVPYSRMETPLPSALRRFTSGSAWGQVGPPRYGREQNSLCSVRNSLYRISGVACAHVNSSHILLYAPSFPLSTFAAANYCVLNSLNQC